MQTSNKKTIGFLVCGLVLSSAHLVTAAEDAPDYRPYTIGVDGGTTGFGASVNWRFSDNFGVRGGVNYLSYDTEQFDYTTRDPGSSDVSQKYDGTLRLLSEPLALDYYPSAKSAFHISVGVLINQNRFTSTVDSSSVPNSAYILNGIGYAQSLVGDLELEVEQEAFSPYLGIGTSIYLDKARHWAVSGELGVAYTGSPDVTLNAPNHDGILDGSTSTFADDLNAEAKSVEDDADDYKFYPIVKIGMTYSF